MVTDSILLCGPHDVLQGRAEFDGKPPVGHQNDTYHLRETPAGAAALAWAAIILIKAQVQGLDSQL